MANGVNKVILLGNLGADPEVRYTQGGTAVMSLRLATAEPYKDKAGEWQERTEWHSVTVWAARAEGLAKVLAKGARIFVEGSLRTSAYDDRDGNKRYKTEINASNVVLCGGPTADKGQARAGNARGSSSTRPAKAAPRRDEPADFPDESPAEQAYEVEVVGPQDPDVPF